MDYGHYARCGALLYALCIGFMGCSEDVVPPVGETCIQNSDCKNPLSCTFGQCHEECQESRDCPGDARCVVGANDEGVEVRVCQLEEQKHCDYNSDCPDPLICAQDFQCRNQCKENRDCATGSQSCVQPDGVCAEPEEVRDGELLPGVSPTGRTSRDEGTEDGGMEDPGPDRSRTDSSADTDAGSASPSAEDGGAQENDEPVQLDGVTINHALVRQGEIGITITVSGEGLANPRELSLGDLTLKLRDGGTDSQFEVGVGVPHGAELGKKDFSFRTDGGIGGQEELVEVTAITASPEGDDSNRGTPDSPFKTVHHAVDIADEGDTVQLLEGVYDDDNGETWPISIRNGVTLVGMGEASEIVGPSANTGLTFVGDAVLKDFKLGYFQYNVQITEPGQEVTFDHVFLEGSSYYSVNIPRSAMGATVRFTGDSQLTKCSNHCIYAYAPQSTLILDGGSISSLGNAHPLYVTGEGITLEITGTSFSSADARQPLSINGLGISATITDAVFQTPLDVRSAEDSAVLAVRDTEFPLTAANNSTAIYFQGATLDLENVSITDARYGVQQISGSAKVRGLAVRNYGYYGYYLQRTSVLDMGTADESGRNIFEGPDQSGRYGLYDYRTLAPEPITVSGTTFNGFLPPAQQVPEGEDVAVTEDGLYRIQTAGNSIVFYDAL